MSCVAAGIFRRGIEVYALVNLMDIVKQKYPVNISVLRSERELKDVSTPLRFVRS